MHDHLGRGYRHGFKWGIPKDVAKKIARGFILGGFIFGVTISGVFRNWTRGWICKWDLGTEVLQLGSRGRAPVGQWEFWGFAPCRS